MSNTHNVTPASTITRHRFAEVHQACAAASGEALWTTLENSKLSVIATSNVCDKIIKNVNSHRLSLLKAITNLQNLLLSCKDDLKTSVYLRTITLLLQSFAAHGEWPENVVFQADHSVQGVLHPFIAISRQRPELYDDIFFEVEFLLDGYDETYENDLMDIMSSFFNHVLLTAETDKRTALLARLAKVDLDPDLRGQIYYYLTEVMLHQFPTQRDVSAYFQLADVMITVFSTTDLPDEELCPLATSLFYQLLCRACNSATYQRPTLPYLQRLQTVSAKCRRGSDARLASSHFHIVWTALSYLLLTAQTVYDQNILLSLMLDCIRSGPQSNQNIILVAILPLFQTWAEATDEDSRKSMVMQLLEFIDNQSTTASNEDTANVIDSIKEETSTYEISGVLAHMIQYIRNLVRGKSVSNETPINTASVLCALLFSAPDVFSTEPSTRHDALNRVAALASVPHAGTSYKFPVFLLLLYVLRQSNLPSQTFLHILYSVMPSLVDPNDPTTTAKILQLIHPLMYSGHTMQIRNTSMASVGYRVLVKIYEQQPRAWQELKKFMTNWILSRKSVSYVTDDKTAIQMEIVVLTSMRDLCRTRARETAQDILPMLVSLLQSCKNLSVSSMAIIVEAVCACVEAGLAEPRPIWNVAVSYIAEYAMTCDQNEVAILWEKLGCFFAIVGDKDEVSEPYIEFKSNVLNNFLAPLMYSENERVKSAALSALSHFPAVDILPLLPEKAKEFTDIIIASPTRPYAEVLVRLLSHELDHMRRGLFAEEAPTKRTEEELTMPQQRSISVLSEKEHRIGNQFVTEWEQARTAPGLRAGHMFAVLHAANGHMTDKHSTAETMNKTKWYRCMTTSIADITLTDHLLIRVSSLGGWTSLFQTALGSDEASIEAKSTGLLKDLLGRLEKSTVPGMTCNIFLALAGLVIATHRTIPSFGVSCAKQVIDVIYSKYLSTAEGTVQKSTLFISEEVQFAVYFSLGHIAACIVTNEKKVGEVLNTLLDSVLDGQVGRALDSNVDLIQFAKGYAAGHLTAALATWPTKTPGVAAMAENGLHSLLDYCNAANQQISDSKALGIMVGWASRIRQKDMQEVYWFARETLKLYLERSSNINMGILLGACWVCAYGALTDDGEVDEECANIVENAAVMATKDIRLTPHLYHFTTAVAWLYRLRLIASDRETEASEDYRRLINQETLKIERSEGSGVIPSLFALANLLGVDFLETVPDTERLMLEWHKYSASAREDALDILTSMAGLVAASAGPAFGNLKTSRITAALCGKLVQRASAFRAASILEQKGAKDSALSGSSPLLLNPSTEPKSYARLNNNTSYLRAVFDSMTRIAADVAPSIACLDLFLTSLRDTPGPLPPVNWFQLLRDISKISSDLRAKCIRFASSHANTSTSLTEFIISQLVGETVSDLKVQRLLASDSGLGKVLELSGLPNRKVQATEYKRRGMSAVTKKSSISHVRCIEILEIYIKSLKTSPIELKLTALTTLCDHLPPLQEHVTDEQKADLIQTLRDITLFNVTLPLMKSDPLTLRDTRFVPLIQKAVRCSVTSKEQLEIPITSENSYALTAALAEMYKLKRAPPPQWTIDIVRELIVQKVCDPATWTQVSQAILHCDDGKFAWVVRLLDIFIVIGSDKSLRNGGALSLLQVASVGLHQILSALWWWPQGLPDADPSVDLFFDTSYMLSFVVSLASQSPQEQQQIIKRVINILKLIETLQGAAKKDLQTLFTQVIKDIPKEAVTTQLSEEQLARLTMQHTRSE